MASNPVSRSWNIWVCQDNPDGSINVAYPSYAHEEKQSVWVEEHGISFGQIAEPSLYLGEDLLRQLVTKMQEQGVRPDSESVAEGKLIATEAHLQDLREMLGLAGVPTVKRAVSIES